MEIGDKLRDAREEKGISLDHLQETTKIQKRYLIAIEEGNYNVLPGKFYAKAFIKEYANAVGLDAYALLDDFVEQDPIDEDESIQYTRIQRSRKNSSTKSSAMFSFIPTMIVLLLVVGIFLVAWALYQQTGKNVGTESDEPQENDQIIRNVEEEPPAEADQDNASENDTPADGENTPDANDTEVETKGSFQVIEEGTGNSPESTVQFSNAGESIALKFTASGESYVDVKGESGESYFSGMFNQTESPLQMEITDEEKLYFNIGNASNISVSINDVEMEYPVDPSKHVHQKIWVLLNETNTEE
ncbi:helix-turn-helix domain-containing protein [Virgibacillus sp. W0430]|uniref:helix-turn-helix domain-containing protein n=1 Tax=Virgibacillus sp. W0430 TaxID=3391580 RepID=UPI003F4896BF